MCFVVTEVTQDVPLQNLSLSRMTHPFSYHGASTNVSLPLLKFYFICVGGGEENVCVRMSAGNLGGQRHQMPWDCS